MRGTIIPIKSSSPKYAWPKKSIQKHIPEYYHEMPENLDPLVLNIPLYTVSLQNITSCKQIQGPVSALFMKSEIMDRFWILRCLNDHRIIGRYLLIVEKM